MEVKIKRLSNKAVVPSYAKNGDAGMDITATSKKQELTKNGIVLSYGTDLAIEIPEGYVGLIFPRSSLSKTSLELTNSVGVIDSGYRGEIKFKFRDTSSGMGNIYEVGDRIGQIVIMPYPKVNLVEVDELTDTDRGTGGFGSTNEQDKKQDAFRNGSSTGPDKEAKEREQGS